MNSDLTRIYASALVPYAEPMVAETLLREAEAATGLSDWGGARWGETRFRRRFDALCQSLESDAELSTPGRSRAHSRLHVMLCSRLRQVRWRAERGEGAPIVAPLIGTGLPRAGTTFLHNLIAQDPGNLSATAAQSAIPVPPPGTDAALEEERVALYRRILAFQSLSDPYVSDIHPYVAEASEECVFIQESSGSALYGAYFNVPAFSALAAADFPDAYAWQKGMMQTLQEGRTFDRWALKAPGHMMTWSLMFDTFPGARVFLNHRDPGKVIPSIASLLTALYSAFSDRVFDPQALGASMLSSWKNAMDEVMAWRAAHPEVVVVDVIYSKLIADPIGEAERLYAAFGLELGAGAKQRMEQFLKVDHHGKGAPREYRLADYGLTEADIEATFGDYIDRMGVVREKRK